MNLATFPDLLLFMSDSDFLNSMYMQLPLANSLILHCRLTLAYFYLPFPVCRCAIMRSCSQATPTIIICYCVYLRAHLFHLHVHVHVYICVLEGGVCSRKYIYMYMYMYMCKCTFCRETIYC